MIRHTSICWGQGRSKGESCVTRSCFDFEHGVMGAGVVQAGVN
jgi:hypothetical protein